MNEQEYINLGIVGIKNMGEYNSETNYEKLNVVTYAGSSYCALRNTIGNLPTDNNYWQLYAEKGDVGPQGPKPEKGVDYFTNSDKEEIESDLVDDIDTIVSESIGSLTSATPLPVSSTSAMIDTTRIYVNTSDGYWYYYNGTDWVQGGVYQASVDSTTEERLINRTNKLAEWEYTNLFNKNNAIQGKFYVISDHHTNGLRDSAAVFISNEIEVHEGDLIHVEGLTTSQRYYCIAEEPDTYISQNYLRALTGSTSYDIVCDYDGYFSIAGFVASELDTMIMYKTAVETLSDITDEFANKIDNKFNINSKFNDIASYGDELFVAGNCITGKYYDVSGGISSGLRNSPAISISEEFYVHAGDVINIDVVDTRDHAYLISDTKGTYTGQIHMLQNNTTYEITADKNGYFSFALFNTEKENVSLTIEQQCKIKEISPIFQSNRFYNKTASFMGDSITYGSNTNKTYDKFLKEMLNLSEIYNYGIRGSSISSGQQSMATRCLNMHNSDLIIVFGGTNDFGNTPTQLGDLYYYNGNTKVYNLDNSTFAGAMNLLCKNLLENYYGKEIYILSPIHRFNFGQQPSDKQKNSLGYTLYEYVDIMKQACEEWGIKFINMLSAFEYNPNISVINQTYFSNDGLHPNANGHQKLAETIINEIL